MDKRTRAVAGSAVSTAVVCVLLYTYLFASEKGTFPTLGNLPGFVLSAFFGVLLGALLHYLNHFLDGLLSWKGKFSVRFLTGFLSYLLLSFLVIAGFSFAIFSMGSGEIIWTNFTINDDDLVWKLLIVLLVGSFIYSVIYSILFSYNQYAFTQIEALQQERKQQELQFEALKNQLSPHYLFNSLNTISSLIYNDPQTAEQFIRRLSQSYQYILATQRLKYVTLKEELEFVKSYYYLLRIRFQQMLNIEINVPNSIMQSPIPPLTLQLLVENAVKHNSLTQDKPLFIYISSVDNSQLKIVNTKSVMEANPATSMRIGLDNIRQRYGYFTEQKIEVRNDENYTVLLPVIQNLPQLQPS